MGKSICFFITEKDVMDLISFIKTNGGVEINEEKNQVKNPDKLFFALPDSELVFSSYNDEKRLNQIESEIIELSFSTPQPFEVLDLSVVEKHFKKGEFVVIDDMDKFHHLMNELKKNPVYIDNPNYIINGYEPGRIWFENQYYDVNGNKKNKSKKLSTLFLLTKRYIQKNYILSMNKDYYIGIDAFKKYVDGEFVPCSGNNVIRFPKENEI